MEDGPNGQIWRRSFGDKTLETRQTFGHRLLLEAKGASTLVLGICAVDGRVEYKSVGARLWLLPLPAFAAPTITASVWEGSGPNCWKVCVRVDVSILGFIGQYEGEMRAEA